MTNNNVQDDFTSMTTIGERNYKSIYFLKPKMKMNELPHFQVKTKDSTGQYVEQTDRLITKITGNCIMIESGSYTFENQEIKTVKVFLAKNETLAIVTMSYTTATCSFINSLLNLNEKPVEISFSLYQDKMGYNKMATLFDGKLITWKYNTDTIKTFIDSTTLNKKVITDNGRWIDKLSHELVMFINNHYLSGKKDNELFDNNECGIPTAVEDTDFFEGCEPFEPPTNSKTKKK